MKINTKFFGEFEIADDKIITFEKGIIGFPELKHFTMLHDEEKGSNVGIRYLQSLEEPGFAMPVMDPLLVNPQYDPEVDEQTFQDTMEGLWGEIEDKADGYAKIIMGMKADIEALRTEESRLAARRKALENRQQALKNNLEATMREMGKTKFKTALFSFNIQKNGGLQPLVIDGLLEDIPGRFLIPQPPVPNNEAIRALLENKAVEWAHLEPRGESLRIR